MDTIIKALTLNGEARVYVTETTELVEEARMRHHTSKTATAALGRTLTANVILGAGLKEEKDSISIQIRTEGQAGNIIALANARCEVKGYISHPDADLPLRADGKLDVGGLLTTDGTLTIVKDIGLKEPYTGTIPLISGEIAEDITYYFAKSEQIPTSVGLGVLVDKDSGCVLKAGGFMIQLLPEASEETIRKIEDILNSGITISKLLAEHENMQEILDILLNGLEYECIETLQPKYQCDCSKARFERGLISLGEEELTRLIDAKEPIQTVCHFCNRKYEFSLEELEMYRRVAVQAKEILSKRKEKNN